MKNMLIEENMLHTDDGKTMKFYNRIPENLLADPRGIEQYLKEMESSDEDIKNRGFRDFSRMCKNKRTAWYFSEGHSPKFKDRQAVKDFFKKCLLDDSENKLKWLSLLNDMVIMETPGSFWKRNLYECCKELLWRIAWKSENFDQRLASIRILRRFPEVKEDILCWAFHTIKEDTKEEDFARLRDVVPSILFEIEGSERKYPIREKLNEFTLQSEKLRKRIDYVLQNVRF